MSTEYRLDCQNANVLNLPYETDFSPLSSAEHVTIDTTDLNTKQKTGRYHIQTQPTIPVKIDQKAVSAVTSLSRLQINIPICNKTLQNQ